MTLPANMAAYRIDDYLANGMERCARCGSHEQYYLVAKLEGGARYQIRCKCGAHSDTRRFLEMCYSNWQHHQREVRGLPLETGISPCPQCGCESEKILLCAQTMKCPQCGLESPPVKGWANVIIDAWNDQAAAFTSKAAS